MSETFSPASQVILRHKDDFINRRVLFAGTIQDNLPIYFTASTVNVFSTMYSRYQLLVGKVSGVVEFNALPSAVLFDDIDTLVYYWPKTKREAEFQLANLLSRLPPTAAIFIVGENRGGVRACEKYLTSLGRIKKIDSARRCSLYHFQRETSITFNLDAWWQRYTLPDNSVICALPGVFSANHLDNGSQLLLSALTAEPAIVKGSILDVGCGAGVLSAVLAKIKPGLTLTLTDISAIALASAQATLDANQLSGRIIASNVYSDITGLFDLIISNPPFHSGISTDYVAAEALIRGAKHHLRSGGHLCLVANAFLPYPHWLEKVFGHYQILVKTTKFAVYLANKD